MKPMKGQKETLCLLCLALSVAVASEKDKPPKRSEKIRHWRHVKKFAEYDRPAMATPQSPASAPGNRHQNNVGTVPTDPHADSDADTAGQHGLDHPAVAVDLSELECTCSHRVTTSGGPLPNVPDADIVDLEAQSERAPGRLSERRMPRQRVTQKKKRLSEETARAASCERVGGGVGRAVSLPDVMCREPCSCSNAYRQNQFSRSGRFATWDAGAYASIRQHTSAYVSIRSGRFATWDAGVLQQHVTISLYADVC
jgi:hypothetical protein